MTSPSPGAIYRTLQLTPSQISQSSRTSSIHPSPPIPPTLSTFGDSPEHKDPTSFRIIMQNPHGISHYNECFEYHLYMDQMNNHLADVICLSETNLQWTDYSTTNICSKYRKNVFRHSKQITSNSNLTYDTPFQPGGTCTVLCNSVVGRYHNSISDPLGRWSVATINTSGNTKLSIITCYQVFQSNTTPGPKSAYTQQWTLLRKHGNRTPNPRKQFIKDLDSLLTKLRQQNHSLIIVGDFNETISPQIENLHSIVTKHHLVDAVHAKHGPYNIPTYNKGSKTIDYIFVSHAIAPYIVKSGILDFTTIISSDHRPIFVDLDSTKLFGKPLDPLLNPPSRVLQANNPKADKYIKSLHQSLSNHHVFDRISDLSTITNPSVAQAFIEQIDRDITRSMLASEKKLKRHRTSPFSSNLAQACLRVTVLKIHHRSIQKHKDYSTTINKLIQQLHKPINLSRDLTTIKRDLKSARKTVTKIRKHAVLERFKYLESLLETSDNPKLIRRIIRAEELRLSYLKIKYAINPAIHSLITKIDIPTDNLPPKQSKQWTTITDPPTINQLLFDRNVQHFGVSHNTPFTVPPLSTDFNWTADSQSAQSTLAGYPPTYDNHLVNRILAKLKAPNTSTLPTLTLPQLIKRLRRWKETTTTSPSGRHLGHYKSLLPPHPYDIQEFKKTQAGQILSVHLAILNFCATTGYSLHRWQKIVTTMIPKEPNNFKIHKLRVIHLYEADLTALFSTWSNRMTRFSEKHNLLHPGSYGARPGRTSTDPPFIAALQIELSTLSRTSLALAPNDASQCYDRILSSTATLSSISHGMAPTAARCIGNTLCSARYHLKTSLSISNNFWQHSPSTPIYGTGQGSGISPGLCSVTYSDLFHVHSDIAHKCLYYDPYHCTTLSLGNIGFVDDTTTSTNDLSGTQSIDNLRTNLQSDLQVWSDLLFTYGGYLEFNKTVCYLMHWQFSNQGIPRLENFSNTVITLQDQHTPQSHSIPVTPNSTAFKCLGFHLRPDQSMATQYQHLHSKAHRLAYAISGSTVSTKEALITYFAVYLPAISYVLPITTFTPSQCHQISSIPTKLFLSKAGFNSQTHRSIIYASRPSGGLGFRPLYNEQGIQHVQKFIQSIRIQSPLRSLLIQSLLWWQVHSGIDKPLLECPLPHYPHLAGTWFTSTRQFLASVSAKIVLPFHTVHPPFRERDVAIMSHACNHSNLSSGKLNTINQCRLFLQVTFLSELCNTKGTEFIAQFLNGDITCRPSPPTHQYPRQSKPSKQSWKVWSLTLRRLFGTPRTNKLQQSLGSWTRSDHGRFPAISIDPLRLWITSTTCYRHLTSNAACHHFSHQPTASVSPPVTVPVDFFSTTATFVVTTRQLPHVLPTIPPVILHPRTFPSNDLLHHLQLFLPRAEIKAKLETTSSPTCTILAASDGGVKSDKASFGWTLRDDLTDLAICFGPVNGYLPSSFRAECVAFLSLITFIHDTIAQSTVFTPTHKLSIHIDNNSLISNILKHINRSYFSPSEASSSERDVLLEIEHYMDTTLLHFVPHHVKSHQDDHHDAHQLSVPSQANVRADSLATHSLRHLPSSTIQEPFPHSGCSVVIDNRTITRSIPYFLRKLSYDPLIRSHIFKRNEWPPNVSIDWTNFELFTKQIPSNPKFFVKFIHRILPSGKIAHRNNPSYSSLCPACNTHETNDHVFQCTHLTRIPLKQKLMSTARKYLATIRTDPILKDILIEGLQSCIQPKPFSFHLFSQSYQQLCNQQHQIGWLNFLRGFATPLWSDLELAYRLNHNISLKLSSIMTVLTQLSPVMIDLWKYRNSQRHDSDLALHETELRRRTTATMSQLYSYRQTVLPTDRIIFHRSLEEHLQQPLSLQLAWISNNHDLILQSHQEALTTQSHNTRPITSYFRTT